MGQSVLNGPKISPVTLGGSGINALPAAALLIGKGASPVDVSLLPGALGNTPYFDATLQQWLSKAGGKVVQVVMGSTSVPVTTNQAVWVDTGLTASITPKYSTSKLIVLVSQTGIGVVITNSNTPGQYQILKLLRNNVDVHLFGYPIGYLGVTVTPLFPGSCSTTAVVLPGSTNLQTFKTQMQSVYGGNATVYAQNAAGNSSSMVILEVLP